MRALAGKPTSTFDVPAPIEQKVITITQTSIEVWTQHQHQTTRVTIVSCCMLHTRTFCSCYLLVTFANKLIKKFSLRFYDHTHKRCWYVYVSSYLLGVRRLFFLTLFVCRCCHYFAWTVSNGTDDGYQTTYVI